MRKVEELQQQILTLSREEFAELRVWFWEHDSIAWDAQSEAELSERWQRRYRELVEGRVAGVSGPFVFSNLRTALSLTAEERAELDRCLDAYERDPNAGRVVDAEWLKEAKDRLAAYRSGQLKAVEAEQVFSDLGRNLTRQR